MPNPEFPFDEESAAEASSIVAALRESHFKEIEERPQTILSPGGDLKLVQESRGRLTKPLREISREIPMKDVLDDLQDFGVLAAYGRMTDGVMTALRIRGGEAIVPLLPQHGLLEQYQRMGWPFMPPDFGWFREKFFHSGFDGNALQDVPLQKAQESFFSGLRSFLTARIGGVRWLRSNRFNSGGTGGGGGRKGGGGGVSSAQMWEVRTTASGLSLAYHGTHAARVPMALPGGVTTPVNVYLPVGTLWLGADVGVAGTFIFDYAKMLTVPDVSSHPVHKMSSPPF